MRSALLSAMVIFPFALPLSPALNLNKVRFHRSDLLWALSILLLSISSIGTGELRIELLTFGAAFLAYKGGQAAVTHCASGSQAKHRDAFGLAFIVLFVYALIQALFNGDQRVSGPIWFGHPNLFAPVMLLVGFSAAAGVQSRWRWLVGVGTLVPLVLTGSRSSLIALFVALALAAAFIRGWRRTALVTFGVGVVAILLASFAFPGKTWAQRLLSPIYSSIGFTVTSKNLLTRTEDLGNLKHWNHIGVDVVLRDGPKFLPAVWTVSRIEPTEWARPQQVVEVMRGEPYTLSAAFSTSSRARPGLIGWASSEGSRIHFEVGLFEEQAVLRRNSGLEESSAHVIDLENGWRRLAFTFTLSGAGVAEVAIGVSPKLESDSLNDSVDFKELQLEVGHASTGYVPAIEGSAGLGEARARGKIFEIALKGVLKSPWFGLGSESFTDFYATREPTDVAPSHAHNAYLQTAFSSGLLGLAALICIMISLFWAGGPVNRVLLIGLAVANVFDSTLTAGVVLHLAAFVMSNSLGAYKDTRASIRQGSI